MSDLFIKIFNLSVTAGWLVLAVLLCRPLMKKAPKWINCLLWGIVGLRLVFPFSLESIFSLVPSAEPLPPDIMLSPTPEINSGIGAVNSVINPIISSGFTPEIGTSVNPMQLVVAIASVVWVIGIALMLGYEIVSYISLRFKVRASVRGEKNVYFCDEVDSPFILGVIRPRIYVPSGMSGEALEHVLAHERAHLRRGDHFWKPIGFAILAFYWFNPLLWVAYVLLCRDIESACDEKVIKTMDTAAKKSYSEALLSCSLHRKRIMACPLAFGEVGVKQRIKSVLNYKKPAFWIIIIALVATLVLSVCFLTNPKGKVLDELVPGSKWLSTTGPTISFGVYENGSVEGIINTADGNRHNIVIHYRKAGSGVVVDIVEATINDVKYESENLTVTPEEHNEWYEQQVAEHSLISGMFRMRRGDLVLTVKKNSIGIESEEIVFKNVSSDDGELYYKIDLPGGTAKNYIYIHGAGFDNNRAEITFRLARCKDDDIYFVLGWKNKTLKPQMRGPDFEVYRYENGVPIALEHISYWKMYAVSVDALATSYPSYNITEHYDISAPGRYRFECNGAWVEFEVVREDKKEASSQSNVNNATVVFDPSYFPYDSSRKYDVYVWQMGPNSFSFGLLESKPRSWLDDELGDLKGVNASQMRQILLDKNLGPNDVNIVHWHNPVSSYIGDFWVNWQYIDDNAPQENFYYAIVYDMLFGASPRRYYPTATETEWFDIDGDGTKEENRIFFGLVDGKFMFRYIIKDDKTVSCNDIFYTAPMSLKFFTSEEKLRLRGVTEDGGVHIYDIVPENGHVKLVEINSTPIADPSNKTLDLSKADISLVNSIVVTNGKTGEVAYLNTTFNRTAFNGFMNALKTVKASDPVSNKGHSGFNYHVELYYDFQTVFTFSLCNEPTDAPRIVCGYYETDGGVDYAARYQLTGEAYAKLDEVLRKYFK